MSVVKLELVEIGEHFRHDPDVILEEAKGQAFPKLAIVAQRPDGTIWITGNANAGETLILLELAKHRIIHGDT